MKNFYAKRLAILRRSGYNSHVVGESAPKTHQSGEKWRFSTFSTRFQQLGEKSEETRIENAANMIKVRREKQ